MMIHALSWHANYMYSLLSHAFNDFVQLEIRSTPIIATRIYMYETIILYSDLLSGNFLNILNVKFIIRSLEPVKVHS